MRNAFIIRPFSPRQGIDFERVERELIGPALDSLDIPGRTTLEILKSGNIRVDMFQRLLTADVVIVDISIHNANVFYELGLRHALRRFHTVMVRAKSGDTFPFDLFTDRYFTYDPDRPAEFLGEFITIVRKTIESKDVDSPLFQLLPAMTEQKPEAFLPVPLPFIEAVAQAKAEKRPGDLALLADETEGQAWRRPALRLIGRAQFSLGASAEGEKTWTAIREVEPHDIEANLLLSTIFHRLGKLAESDAAVDRVLAQEDLAPRTRAEAWALRARNEKTRWLDTWKDATTPADARVRALASGHLRQSAQHYAKGYRYDLTHSYSGINALAMVVILTELAAALPDTWNGQFEDDDKAEVALKRFVESRTELGYVVHAAIAAEQERTEAAGKRDEWADISAADLTFYRGATPSRVKARYQLALGTDPFNLTAARDQLHVFKRLGIFSEAVDAALAVLPTIERPKPPHTLLFSGHRVDDPDRRVPRFPADRVEQARTEIAAAVDEAIAEYGADRLVGIAGAASGGDILFHEECRARGVATTIYLALPPEAYVTESVSPAGSDWTKRFHALVAAGPVRVLQASKTPPPWLSDRDESSVWARANLWMLHNAFASGGGHLTFIALWNGAAEDGPGGTAHMFEAVKKRGGQALRIGQGTIFPAES